MGILSVDLNNISLDDANFTKRILKILFMSDFWLGIPDLENA